MHVRQREEDVVHDRLRVELRVHGQSLLAAELLLLHHNSTQ